MNQGDGQQPGQQHGQQPGQQRHRKKSRYKHKAPQGPRQTQQFKSTAPEHGRQQPLGPFFGPVPSIQDLQRENRRRTKQHYRAQHFPNGQQRYPYRGRPTPKSVPPPAPLRRPSSFLGAGHNPLETPTLPTDAALGHPSDKLEAEGLHADLDFYGTNEGLYNEVFYNEEDGEEERSSDGEGRSLSRSEGESSEGEAGKDDRPEQQPEGSGGLGRAEDEDMQRRILRRLRERVGQQDAYIAQLEDDNLNLRERLDITQQEIEELKAAARGGGGKLSSSDNEDHSVAAAPGEAGGAPVVPGNDQPQII